MQYQQKLSGPVLDRIDLHVRVVPPPQGLSHLFHQLAQGDMAGKSVLELFRDVELSARVQGALKGQYAQAEYQHLGRVYQVLFSPAAGGGAMVLLLDVTERALGERMRREFTANVTHELKTPLTSISGYAEMIAGGMVREPELQRFAARIHSEAARLLALIDDILLLSQLDEAQGEAFAQRVNLAQVAREAVRALEEKRPRPRWRSASGPGHLGVWQENHALRNGLQPAGQRHQIQQARAAYRHCGPQENQALLTVADTGRHSQGAPKPGFERFYRWTLPIPKRPEARAGAVHRQARGGGHGAPSI